MIKGLTTFVKVRHTGDAAAKVQEAAEVMWESMLEAQTKLAQRYIELSRFFPTDKQYEVSVLDTIAVIPENREEFSSANRYWGARERALEKRESVRDLWTNGREHTGNKSAWEALNGAIEAIDHDPDNVFRKRKNKVHAIVAGPDAILKGNITKNLLQLAEAA